MSILILNASPNGRKSNCQVLIQKVISEMKQKSSLWGDSVPIQTLHLAECKWTSIEKKKLFAQLKKAKAFIFVTGTYWDSWGSPLQVFLENVTELEGSPAFLGKPAAVLVLNHSVGGKGVLSRLQGVLSTLGCLIPPMSGMVYSWVSDQVLKSSLKAEMAQDLWSLQDLSDILQNLHHALRLKIKWAGWPVDRKNFRKTWLT